jgi:GNAT superfamily N-acetyltransferase
MKDYRIISIRENPEYLSAGADYFAAKWGAGHDVYNDCITRSIDTPSPLPRWYLLVKDDGVICGCFGLITNDFNSRQDLWPWLAALYVEESERGQALGGKMLAYGVAEAKKLGFDTVYLATDHIGYYEKYGWTHIGACYDSDGAGRLYSISQCRQPKSRRRGRERLENAIR